MSASDSTAANEAAAPESPAPGNRVDVAMGDVSPKSKSVARGTAAAAAAVPSLGSGLASLDSRADPDAQTTVTDFLDFTEYLPSDVTRSLTLIGKLDQDYADASHRVHDLTALWGRLPSVPAEERPSPVRLRADISESLAQAVSSRTFAHAEAVRMSENVNRHYNKAKVLLAKLQTMMDNYPKDDAMSPVAPKSPQLVRAKVGVRAGGDAGQKTRRSQVPRIVVPGEVLAPYDLEYDTFTDDSESSSEEESDTPIPHRTPITQSRIKIVSAGKPQKTPNRLSRQVGYPTPALSAAAAANLAALRNPPPEDAVVGSQDAPWLQLTQYELAKLRKRMKKNATWTPSDTMVARELKALGRGPEAYREAKKMAEDEGQSFEPTVPKVVVDEESGVQQLPTGAISVDSAVATEPPTNRGIKLNEAKKVKREALAKQAAEEAEESARKMAEAAKLFLGNNGNNESNGNKEGKGKESKGKENKGKESRGKKSASEGPREPRVSKTRSGSRSTKRKREAEAESNPEVQVTEPAETPTPKPQPKRIKTETPVPPPHHPPMINSKVPTPDNSSTTLSTPTDVIPHLETPVPIPVPPQGSSMSSRAATSPTPSVTASSTVTTSVPVKFPPTETPVPLPVPDRRKSATPVLPPVRETPTLELTKRETRADVAKRSQQQLQTPSVVEPPRQESAEPVIKQSSSRAATPITTPGPEAPRRPSSRGKAMSQEPQPSLAADRPRRASTARNTPAPEPRPVKRTKRPAPGIVSTTNSGGNSAVGKRKAAPRKKPRVRKDKDKDKDNEMEEVDDEGNPIDPDEPRYCSCNRVSFGTMIQCDNEVCALRSERRGLLRALT